MARVERPLRECTGVPDERWKPRTRTRLISEHIEQRGGVYYVPGTRVSLDSIVYAFREGCSPESIREDFDGLTLAYVYGAIAFYLDHQADIDAYLLRRIRRITISARGSCVAQFAGSQPSNSAVRSRPWTECLIERCWL